MICSMTTFARSTSSGTGWSCTMELKSVNGRYCDIHLRIPRSMYPLEDRIKKLIQQRIRRGRIDFSIQFEGTGDNVPSFYPDIAAGRAWLRAAEQLSQELRLAQRPSLNELLSSMPNVIIMNQGQEDEDELWNRLTSPLNELLNMAREMSEKEGRMLALDMEERLEKLAEHLENIAERHDFHLEAAQDALQHRIIKLLDHSGMDKMRIAHEAAIMADKLDITEEIVRARSHVGRFREYLQLSEPVGRRLDFLAQELFREFNTMASKSCDEMISQVVVEVKGELEKIREQVQNIV